jgi:hypothetical protein
MKHEIFGISTDMDIKFDEKFEVIYDSGETMIAQSKETFTHEEEGLNFKYKYVIEVADGNTWDGENNYYIELSVVPTFDSLCNKKKEYLLDSACVEECDVNIYDVFNEGYSLFIGYEKYPTNDIPMDEHKEVTSALDSIASVFETINAIRGFYFDKYVNRIGNTGWDFLNDFINDIPFIDSLNKRVEAGEE